MGVTYRLSVITVVRNAASQLAATIESVRRQTYQPIEFIVVDGASSDGTTNVLRQHASRIDKWISEPDRGLYDAMNKGKTMATGDFAMFVNAGDTFVDDHVVASMMAQAREGGVLYFGKVRLVDCTGRLSWEVPILRSGREQPPVSYLPHHQSVFYPRSYYLSHDYDSSMGYRADVRFTEIACRMLPRHFTNVTTIESTLGGTSSRAITSIAELRKEIVKETAYARYVAATTGDRTRLIDVTSSLLVKYLASKAGGAPLVHRLMFVKHAIKSRLGLS
jgi:putative colanic acid biosynthesis glycosyltransferase